LVGSGGTGGDSGIGGLLNSGMAFMLVMTVPPNNARSVSDSALYDKLTVNIEQFSYRHWGHLEATTQPHIGPVNTPKPSRPRATYISCYKSTTY
jgi:hypothetical protein